MTEPRYLLIRGPATSARLALPALGQVRIGSAGDNDVVLDEPGVDGEHAVLFLDHGIGVRIGGAITWMRGEREMPAKVGSTIDVVVGDRVAMGTVELIFAAGADESAAHGNLSRAHLLGLLERAALEKTAASILVLRAKGFDRGVLESVVSELAQPLTAIDESTVAVLVRGNRSAAESLAGQLSKALVARGAELEAGIAEAKEGDGARIIGLALQRVGKIARAADTLLAAQDPAMRKVLALADQVAKSNALVLILGETGVGKDLLAHHIHAASPRAQGPLLRVNCVDLGESFIDPDLVQRASGGTILLDEVGGLSARAQLSLGHRLEDDFAQRHDLRFLATSNHDLQQAVAEGGFRKDLYFRLGRVSIEIPPLRERGADILPLARHFIAELSADKPLVLSGDAARAIERYPWPGNVRELRNVLERAVLVSSGGELRADDLPAEVRDPSATRAPIEAASSADTEPPGPPLMPGGLREEMEALERRRILEALDKHPTQTEAAKALGIPLRTFLNRLDALGIPRARKSKE
jgi:transcriptional regulator of acetoin/glycerol metabolism